MTIRIVVSRSATVGEWANTYAASEGSTFFHGPEWSEIWEIYSGGRYKPMPKHIEFSDGVAVVMGVTTEDVGPGIHRYHLSPAGTYGGWVSKTPLTPEHTTLLAEELLDLRSLVWRSSPQEPHPLASSRALSEVTHVIELDDGADVARERWRKSAVQPVRQAQRGGMRFREGATHADWLAYDRLYRKSIDRWAAPSSTYGQRLFLHLHERGSASIRLFLVEQDGELAAGAVVFFGHRHAGWWHGASLGKDAPGASNLLQWEVIGCLAAEDMGIYDLNPSGGHAGVVRFKESLGAIPRPAPIVILPHRLEGMARRIDRWKERLLRQERA